MNKKKLLALLMALVMTLSLVPVTALAEEPEGTASVSTNTELATALADPNVSVINITGDIDLENAEWNPVSISRNLTINGNSHSISNFTVTKYAQEGTVDDPANWASGHSASYYCGFIADSTKNLTINNLTFSNATVDMVPQDITGGSSIVAVVVANNTGNLVFNDVNILNSTVKGYTKVGLLHGFTQSGSFVANHCAIENSHVVLEADGNDPEAAYSGIVIGYDGSNLARTTGIKITNSDIAIDGSVQWGEVPVADEAKGIVTASGYGLTCKTYAKGSRAVDPVLFVAKVDGYAYESLQDAVAAAKDGDTITLLKDAAVDTVITVTAEVTLDLAGFTVTNNVTGARMITINAGACLTVNANGGRMVIPASNTNSYGFFKLAAATIENNKITANAALILNGGSYEGNTDNGAFIRPDNAAYAYISIVDASMETNYRFVACGGYTWSELYVTGGTYTHNNKDIRNNGLVPAFYLAGFESAFDGVTINSQIGSCVEVAGYQPHTKAIFKNNNFAVTETSSDQSWNNVPIAVDSNGEVIVESGTYNGHSGYGLYIFTSGGKVTIKDGTFTGEKAAIRSSFDSNTYGKNGWKAELYVTGGTFNGPVNTNGNADASIELSGGTYNETPDESYIAEDYKAVNNGDGTWTVSAEHVAQIGGVKYETLEAAFAAANDGETITLLADCAGNGIKAPQGKFVTGLTVDFANHTYTVDGATVGSTGTETQAFQLLKDNKITFKNGTITSDKAKMLVQNYSNLTLQGMTLNGTDLVGGATRYVLSNNNGNVQILGTTINAREGDFAFDVCRYSSYPSVSVTVDGDSFIIGNVEISASNNDAKDGFGLTLSSGTMTGNIVMDSSAAAAMAAAPTKVSITKASGFDKAAPEGYKWDGNGKLVEVTYVAQIGSTKYETLADAVNAEQSGDIVLLSNIDLTATVNITKDLTINLAGHNITATDARALHVQSGNVTITGQGKISASGDNLSASSSVIRVGDGSNGSSPRAKASLTIGPNVTVESDKCYGVSVFGVNNTGLELTVNGTINVTGESNAVANSGNSWNTATTMIINGTVISENGYAIYHPGKGTLTVNGTVSGKGGIEAKGGTVTIGQNAHVTATATTQSHTANGNGPSTSGYAIAAVENSGYQGDASVEINGGFITGPIIVEKDSEASWEPSITISGGLFTIEPNSNLIKSGYQVIAADQDPYKYQVGKETATIAVTTDYENKNITPVVVTNSDDTKTLVVKPVANLKENAGTTTEIKLSDLETTANTAIDDSSKEVKIITGLSATQEVNGAKAPQTVITDNNGEVIFAAKAIGGQLRLDKKFTDGTHSEYNATYGTNGVTKAQAIDYVDLRLQFQFTLPEGVSPSDNDTQWYWTVKYNGIEKTVNGVKFLRVSGDTGYDSKDAVDNTYTSNVVVTNIPVSSYGTLDFSATLTISYVYGGVTYTISQSSEVPLTRDINEIVNYYSNSGETTTAAYAYANEIKKYIGSANQ